MKSRKETSINNAFTVESLITVHYLDFSKINKNSSDDSLYDFWQLLYVDKGSYACSIGEDRPALSSGDIVFCEPGKARTSHSYENAMIAIVSFRCNSEKMQELKNRRITLSDEDRRLLSKIISVGTQRFKSITGDNLFYGQQPEDGTEDYELQAIKNNLELLLINLYMAGGSHTAPAAQNQVNYYEEKFNIIKDYMLENIDISLTLDEISEAVGFSQSTIKRIFVRCAGCGALHYFLTLKIKEAKKRIRETDMTMTEISESLGFSSIHYFSRIFKTVEGISPSTYAKSILK